MTRRSFAANLQEQPSRKTRRRFLPSCLLLFISIYSLFSPVSLSLSFLPGLLLIVADFSRRFIRLFAPTRPSTEISDRTPKIVQSEPKVWRKSSPTVARRKAFEGENCRGMGVEIIFGGSAYTSEETAVGSGSWDNLRNCDVGFLQLVPSRTSSRSSHVPFDRSVSYTRML